MQNIRQQPSPSFKSKEENNNKKENKKKKKKENVLPIAVAAAPFKINKEDEEMIQQFRKHLKAASEIHREILQLMDELPSLAPSIALEMMMIHRGLDEFSPQESRSSKSVFELPASVTLS